MGNERILIVDDDRAIRSLCRTILERAGYALVEARNGAEALQLFQDIPFDLLLTDIRMPGMDGLEIVRRLRDRNPELTCVTMTGYSSMETAIQALSLGIDEFIIKPFTPEGLRQGVSRALEKSRLRRENTSLRALFPLFETARALMGSLRQDELADQVVSAARRVTRAPHGALWLVEEKDNQVRISAGYGETGQFQVGSSIPAPAADSIAGLTDGPAEFLTLTQGGAPADLCRALDANTLLYAPLLARGVARGILAVWHALPDESFAPSALEALTILAGQAAAALENARHFEHLTLSYHDLQELDRLKSEFINIASHELRTPLSLLYGYAVLLHEQAGSHLKPSVEMIVDSADRLRRILDDMLSLRYLERGRVELHMEEFSVRQASESVVAAYRALATAKSQHLTIVCDEDSGQIRSDRSLFDLILGNLLSNAVKFTGLGGQIQVEVKGGADQVRWTVRDNGKGIAPENLERIFHSFFQVDSSLTRRHGGLGLGLAIARETTQALGGRIWVESRIGQGSEFVVVLPRSAPVLVVAP